MSSELPTATASLLRLVCRALDEKKAEEIRVLHVKEISSITDYLVLATGTSDPHLRALRVELEKVIDATGTRILGMDTGIESGWVVIDAFDVMIHVMTPDNRRRYAIEALWGDAEDLPLDAILNDKPLAPVKPAKAAKKPKAAAKKPAKKPEKKPAKSKKPAKTKAPAKAKPAKAGKAKPVSSLLRKAAARLGASKKQD